MWGNVSFDATTWIGATPDARFGNVGLRYGRVLAASKRSCSSGPSTPFRLRFFQTLGLLLHPAAALFSIARVCTAGGISPIGLKFNFRRNKRVQPFGAGSGGFLYFNEKVPVTGAARFNFTFNFQGGVQIIGSNQRSFMVGYKYNHISNGYQAPIKSGCGCTNVLFRFLDL